jgi:quercetin dioxygenase-like cupin family protein
MLASLGIAAGQTAVVVNNLDTANWTPDKGGAADTASVMLRADQMTGGMDLLVRFPAGHVIAPHFHDSNERIFVAEGQLTLRQAGGDKLINAGGFAFLPAHEVQRLSCTSKTRCTFYLSWDGKPDSHAAK